MADLAERFRVDGQVALITGAGRGLGRAFALALAEAGADVVLVARSEDQLQASAEAVREATGRRALVVAGDVTDAALAPRAVGCALDQLGRLDILVNNAGTYHMGPIEDTDPAEFQRVLDVNLMGSFLFAKAAGPTFQRQGSGKLVNLSSILGLRGAAEATAYCAAKGGLILFTRALAAEWAPHGIQVNAIAPGLFRTDMSRGVFEDEAFYRQILAGIPRGRHGEPEDLAGTLVYLCSAASDHLLGQVLHVDGGSSIA